MQNLETLFDVELQGRDEAWEKSVLAELPKANVKVLMPEPREGPDSWPYLLVSTGEGADEPMTHVIGWLSQKGIGLAINPQKTTPDYVLTYGMIWNFRERGEFLTPATAPARTGQIEIKHGQELLTGAPSQSYLPPYVRGLLKEFFAQQGVYAPKVLMVSFDKVNYDLCLSIESLNSPPANEHAGIVEALSWFLPAHYTLSLISEKAVPGFQPL